jgi:cell cycle checkpoint protein
MATNTHDGDGTLIVSGMATNTHDGDGTTSLFKAVSSSTRQLYQLLNCINLARKAQVRISPEGITFTVEDSRVMQGR